ncbi:membrane protein insertase YidC [Sphingomonas gilva]|uniref:Membrane protein insertase YidC n=1 Tax=Sphingomonas gilva TaxID=2305907 RepID=A0A396RPW4_9SPHN|nr:membrane protein insertase YidC [Sphingomonas gilva]RHW16303.1 membrane protein insertase YidC [Sphingomonas gilva]
MKDNRNMILAIVLAGIILFGWPFLVDKFFPSATQPSTRVENGQVVANPQPEADPTADTPRALRSRAVVLAETPRVRIDTPRLQGSINLQGARIDDLTLTRYNETVADNSPPIRLFSPGGAAGAYFAGFGWTGEGLTPPDGNTVWSASAPVLRQGQPVTLSATSGGQRYQIQLSIDDGYMFTARQTVGNGGAGAVAVQTYGYLSRADIGSDKDSWTIQVGPMWVANGAAEYGINYDDVTEGAQSVSTTGGWAGFTDHYWLAALIPDQGRAAQLRFRPGANGGYQADYRTAAPTILQPGKAVTQTARLFAGAKEVDLLDRYEDQENVVFFDKAIDWGWFEIVEKPIFYLLDWLFRAVGNFGVAIILLTFIIRGLMFPIAQKQFASMAGMRVVQPKMKALQERYKDDKAQLQQEMLKLYKEEKVNPLAGCLPLLLQIPIFYALYKVLLLTIEMRHQPFALWIKDLAAPDPLTPVNLFGLLDFAPPAFVAIGVLPILVGVTMWMQFKLNPQPMDEIQKQVFGLMPWILMFVMAPFAAGLQLYWATTNILTIAQQKWLYSRHPGLKEAPAK